MLGGVEEAKVVDNEAIVLAELLDNSMTAGDSQEQHPERSITFCSLRPGIARRLDLSELYQAEYCGVACRLCRLN